MNWEWFNLLLILVLSIGMGLGIVLLSWFLGPKRPLPEKLDPYECGMPLLGSSRERFTVKFYLVAIMFMLFDIEVVFMIPWAVMFKELALPGLIEMGVFVAILGFGLIYIFRRGVLDWEKAS